MTWQEFQTEKKAYEAAWKEIVKGAAGDMASFLKKSYLVVTCGRQFDIGDDFQTVAEKCPAFFVDDPARTAQRDEGRCQVNDNWRIEVRFPYVDIDLIQELKHSPYCDQEQTMMRAASINVILKKEPGNGKREQ